MTERLSEITAQIASIRQLGSMVNAMRGIAASRAQQARSQLRGVETYSATLAGAIGRALTLAGNGVDGRRTPRDGVVNVIFCAEQGFAGAFSERVLDGVGSDLADGEIFLIGTRGASIMAERGMKPAWTAAMPSHSLGIPRLANYIAEALYARLAASEIARLEATFGHWQAGKGLSVERRQLFPIDPSSFPRPATANPPLFNLDAGTILFGLTGDYIHAQLCDAALHAFAAENEARMEAMTAARREIGRRLTDLEANQRIVRQDEITSEVVELAAGEAASRTGRA